jgi:hypothetical protein
LNPQPRAMRSNDRSTPSFVLIPSRVSTNFANDVLSQAFSHPIIPLVHESTLSSPLRIINLKWWKPYPPDIACKCIPIPVVWHTV